MKKIKRGKYRSPEHIASNQKLWDRWARLHATGDKEGYDLESFRAGKTSLAKIELNALPDVKGKSLLHLMCHIGIDTMSWARKGARVTGVDLSSEAIAFAQELVGECGVDASFICSDVYDLPEQLSTDNKFDIVFMSYGVLTWLHDLAQLAKLVASYLRPGGIYYLVEFHPFTHMLDEEWKEFSEPYFYGDHPIATEESGSYADRLANVSGTAFEWPHPMSEICQAFAEAGFIMELEEFPFTPCNCFPGLAERAVGTEEYTRGGESGSLPLVFSIKATYLPSLQEIKMQVQETGEDPYTAALDQIERLKTENECLKAALAKSGK